MTGLLIALDPPGKANPVAAAAPRAMFRLELRREARTEAEVDRLVEVMERAACPQGG